MTTPRLLALLALVALVAAGAGGTDPLGLGGVSSSRGDERPGSTITTRVVAVVDGDTIKVRRDGGRETVRLIGIDTPETVKPDAPVECFGPESSREATRLLARERVRLVLDREPRDRFGRLLAYVYRDRDDRFVNADLVRRGYARALRFPPNTRHASRFARLEREARAERRGLWRRCT